MRHFVLLLLLATFTATAARADAACEALLLTPAQATQAFNREFHGAIAGAPLLKRIYLKMHKRALRNSVLKECLAANGCSQTQLAQVVLQIVADTKNPAALGYGFLVGGMLANAAVSAQVMTMVSPNTGFMPIFASSFLGQLSFIGVNLLAPFLEPISAKIRRFTFAMTKRGAATTAARGSLEAQADLINATYTLREQHATDRILTLRNAIRLNFQAAALAIETGDKETVVAELGDAAMAGYRHFRDLSPTEPTIISAVQASFLRKIKNAPELLKPTLEYIRAHDPDFSHPAQRPGELSAQEYYEKAIQAWTRSN